MAYDHYLKLKGTDQKIADLLALDEDVELALPDFNEIATPADLS